MPVGRFLIGVAGLVYNPSNKTYLLLKRAETKDVGAGTWECPAGRVEQGEGIEAAVIREVEEEIQLSVLPEFIVATTHFHYGEVDIANELIGVIYSCTTAAPEEIKISAEHSAYRWLTWEEIQVFLPKDHWILWVIARAEIMREKLPEDLKTIFLEEGFEVGGRNTYL